MKRLKLSACAAVAAAALTLGASSGAHAIVYDLNVDHCTGGCANFPAPFATVTVVQDVDGTSLDFSVQLLGNLVFQASTAFDAFAFNFSDKIASVTNITDNGPGTFTSSPVTTKQDGLGTFKQGIINDTTGGTLLTFTVANETIGNLILSTIPPGDTPSLFAADVSGLNTGNVGGGTPVSGVPEPSTWGMMLLGFVGLGFAFRQSRRKVSFA